MVMVALPAIMNGADVLEVNDLLDGFARLDCDGEKFREHVGLASGVPQTLTFDLCALCLVQRFDRPRALFQALWRGFQV